MILKLINIINRTNLFFEYYFNIFTFTNAVGLNTMRSAFKNLLPIFLNMISK